MDKIISEITHIGAADGYLCYHLQLSARNGTYELGAVSWGVCYDLNCEIVGDFDDYNIWDPDGEVGEGGPYHGAEFVRNDGFVQFQYPGYMTVHYPDPHSSFPDDIEFTDPFDPRLGEILGIFRMSAEDLRKECELLKHAVENDESLETGEETDGSDEEPLGLIGSVRNNDVKAVEGHLASGMGLDKETALFLAAWNDNTRIMELLINAGSDVDFVHMHIDSGTVKKSALMVAAEYNNVKAVKLLLKAGADPNLEGMDGDVTALEIGGDTVYDILIKAGAKGTQWVAARHRLVAAASKGDADMVSLLIEAGADVNGVDSDGWPALHAAARRGDADMASLLIEAGADVNGQDSKVDTPLQVAARGGDANMVSLLLKAGADVNVKGSNGRTPLHAAASKGGAGMASLLIEAGADVNVEDSYGSTPLYEAARKGNADIVKLIKEAGAKV